MSVSRLSSLSRTVLWSVGLLSLSTGAASAATDAPNSADVNRVPSIDRAADVAAKSDLNNAIAALTNCSVKAGRDRLEQAETALLNREVIDLGTALRAHEPLPATEPITHIVSARTSLSEHHISQAVREARQARTAIDTELAMAPSS